MWVATHDRGLVAACHGPNRLEAVVGGGVKIAIETRTAYPFDEDIEMALTPERPVEFPLELRIPGWCDAPKLSVNGQDVEAKPTRGFVRLVRRWSPGDRLRLRLPMRPKVATGVDHHANGAPFAAVEYGPLHFVLPIPERDSNTPVADAVWNYALDDSRMEVERDPLPSPWTWPLASPLRLRATALTFDWKSTRLPPQAVQGGDQTTITLVPYGCTKFRLSMMPLSEDLRYALVTGEPLPAAEPPGAFSLAAPACSESMFSAEAALSWNAAPKARRYRVLVGEDREFRRVLADSVRRSA